MTPSTKTDWSFGCQGVTEAIEKAERAPTQNAAVGPVNVRIVFRRPGVGESWREFVVLSLFDTLIIVFYNSMCIY